MAKKKGSPKKNANKKENEKPRTKYPGFVLDPTNILHRVNQTFPDGFEIEPQVTLPECSEYKEKKKDNKKEEADDKEVEKDDDDDDGAKRQLFPDTGLDDARRIMALNPAIDIENALNLIKYCGTEKALEKCLDLTPVSLVPDWAIAMTGALDDLAPELGSRGRRHPELNRAFPRPHQQVYAFDHERMRGVRYSHIAFEDEDGQEEASAGISSLSIAGGTRSGRVHKMEIEEEPTEIVADSPLEITHPTAPNALSPNIQEPVDIDNEPLFQISSPTAHNAHSFKIDIKQEPVEIENEPEFQITRPTRCDVRNIKREIKQEPAEINEDPQFQHRQQPSDWEPPVNDIVENLGTQSKKKRGKKIKKEPLDEMEEAVPSREVIFEGYNLRKRNFRINYNPSKRQIKIKKEEPVTHDKEAHVDVFDNYNPPKKQIKIKKEEPDTQAEETVRTQVNVIERRVTRAALRNNRALKLNDSGWERVGKNNVSYPSPPPGYRKKVIKKEPVDELPEKMKTIKKELIVDESPKKKKTIESISNPSPPMRHRKRAIKTELVDEPPQKIEIVERVPVADIRSIRSAQEEADSIRQVARDIRPRHRDPNTPCSSVQADEYDRKWRDFEEYLENNGLSEEDL